MNPAAEDRAGSAWSTTAFNLTDSLGLDTTFQFQITEPGYSGADGFALLFVAATDAPTGSWGGGLGYEGIPNCGAVEFDTYPNQPEWWELGNPNHINDPNGNHVGVHTRGAEPNSVFESAALGVATNIPDLSDGATHTARVVYQPPSGTTPGLRVFVDDLVTPVVTLPEFDMATTINLNAGEGYLGFTGSTGGHWENHDIRSWRACTLVAGAATTVPTTTVPTTTTTSTVAGATTTTTGATRPTSTVATTTTIAPSAADIDELPATGPAHRTQLLALLMLLPSWILRSVARRGGAAAAGSPSASADGHTRRPWRQHKALRSTGA